MSQPAQPVRRRHLMDPDNPVRPVNDRSLTNVQRWVMSTLSIITIGHLSAGLIIAACYLSKDDTGGRIILCVIAGAFGAIAVVAAQAIHRKPPLSWWLLVGLIPTVVGLILTLG